MRHSKILKLLLLTMLFAGEAAASTDAEPRQAIGLDDAGKNMVENSVRVRFTRSGWDYIKVTLRDTFKTWGLKGGTGLNNLVDPGYQVDTHSAGPIRTTPLEPRWTTSGQFMQNRKWEGPGGFCNQYNTVNGNARGFPTWDLQNLNREQGFYVTAGTQCWDAIALCSKRTQPWSAGLPGIDITTPHVGGDPGQQCTVDPIYFNAYVANVYIYLNILLHIFPTMYMENQQSPSGEAYNPVDRWPYTGLGGRTYGGETAGAFPTDPQGSLGNKYVGTGVYNASEGSYFRAGDDTAMYFNLYQMQVQGVDRDTVSTAAKGASAVNTCGTDNIYSGIRDATEEPVYYSGIVPQCLRPKMYWKNGTSNVNPKIKLATGEAPHWAQCDAYDTVLLDGTPNEKRDDAEWLYPGNSASYTCGSGSTDPFNPTNAGWYGLKLDSMDMFSDANVNSALKNTIALELSGKDIRIETGIWADIEARTCTAGTCWAPTGIRITRKYVTGVVSTGSLKARLKVRLFSIDDTSCTSGSGADCTGLWRGVDDNVMTPDKLVIDVEMIPATDLELGGLTFSGDTSCVISLFGYCVLSMMQVLNLLSAMITETFRDQLAPLILDAISGVTGSIPNLNTLLGDPWNLGTALLELGVYAAGDKTQKIAGVSPAKWPLRFINGPDGEAVKGGLGGKRQIGDFRFGVGFKPIAFKPVPGANGVMEIDTAEPPAADSVYGIPKLVDPDISVCPSVGGTSYTHAAKASGNYTYSSSTGNLTLTGGTYSELRVGELFFVVAANKSFPILRVDNGSINIGPGNLIAGTGTYRVNTGVITFAASPGTILPGMTFWDTSTNRSTIVKEVITPLKLFVDQYDAASFDGSNYKVLRCSGPLNNPPVFDADGLPDADNFVVSGTFTDTKANPDVLYNANDIIKEYWTGPIQADKKPPTWCVTPAQLRKGAGGLDFARMYPQTTWLSFDDSLDKNPGGSSVKKNVVGGWDQMPANSVLKINSNTGAKETSPVNYDLSVHIHQRLFAELLQAIVASGAACLDFSTKDTEGATTPWASMLSVSSFAAFLPEMASAFPGDATVSVHITPIVTPHVRTGVGRLSYFPAERLRDPIGGPLPIVNERYTLGLAIPDVKIDFLVNDPVTKTQVSMLTAYWSTTLGLFVKAVRKCYKLDPWLTGTPEEQLKCNSTQVNERQVSGYYEFFVDMNSRSLSREFENGRDGLGVGQFTNLDIGTARGQSAFVITSTLCSDSAYKKCTRVGLSQAVPTLLESLVQLFFISRFSLYNFSVDFLYLGADGPNDDQVGGGDYLGVYARFLGNLDVFGLVGSLSLAPTDPDFGPKALIQGVQEAEYIRTNDLSVDIATSRGKGLAGLQGADSYSYRIDEGFWHSPVNDKSISTGPLLEGQHKISIRAFADTEQGAFSQDVPTVLSFYVDTVAPHIEIAPSSTGYFTKSIEFRAHDLQTPDDRLSYRYALNRGDWVSTDESSVSLRGMKPGRHTLRVQATDLAGNVGSATREVVVKSQGWGCAMTQGEDLSLWFVLVAMLSVGFRRRRTAAP